ncbi:MAG: leucine-rich repeat domain-containing protein [Tannerella sp.]|jgi:hypothetical protein|nr:leucine-rich repeat domain-containing protein [Tannerella sp.]
MGDHFGDEPRIIRDDNYAAQISEEGATITEYTGKGGSICIPSEIGGMPVVHIADDVFRGKGITNVILPSTLKTIGRRAFMENHIHELRLEEGLVSIGVNAFFSNRITAKLNLPETLTFIGASAFFFNNITEIVIPHRITEIENSVFHYNRLEKLHIPNGVKKIGYEAFADNKLTTITISDSVIEIEHRAFADNPLFRITMPDNVNFVLYAGTKPDAFARFYKKNGKAAGTYAFDGDFWNIYEEDTKRKQIEEEEEKRFYKIVGEFGYSVADYTDEQIQQLKKRLTKTISSIPEAVWEELPSSLKVTLCNIDDNKSSIIRYFEKGFGYFSYPVIQILNPKSTTIRTASGHPVMNVFNIDIDVNGPPESCLAWIDKIGEKLPDVKDEVIRHLTNRSFMPEVVSYSHDLHGLFGEGDSIHFGWGFGSHGYTITGDKVWYMTS